MNLFNGEEIITTTDGNIVILTTHRIRSSSSIQWGHHSTISIMLEKVSAIQATYNSYPILLILTGIMVIGAVITGSQQGEGAGVTLSTVLAIVLFIGYFATRRHICVITSDGCTKLAFETAKMDKDAILRFIDQIELAKSNRVSQLAT